jgi:tripartite-type tricarboxylate transporter receptor subunit TctC
MTGIALTRFALLLLTAAATAAHGQAFPAKPIRIVVPLAAGGPADVISRTIGAKLAEQMGQPVLIENRTGASGNIGLEHVAKSAPDGYTLVHGTGASHVLNLFMVKNMPVDPVRDFTPIAATVSVVLAVVVHPSVPATSVRELIDYAKKNPGKLSFGSSGTGTPHHLVGELLKQVGGIDMVHVPYKGGNPAMTDLVGGQIPMVVATLSTALPYMRAGKVRVLAVVEPKRDPGAPDIPAISESVSGIDRPSVWHGYFGPPGMPKPIVARLNAEIVKAVNAPDVREKFTQLGMQVITGSPEDLAEMMRSEIEKLGKVVKAAGIKPE